MTRDYCGGGNYSGGALMGGGTVNNPGIQPYKYGTKELDRQNGFPIPGVVKMTDITPEKIADLKNGFGQPLYPELLKQKMNIIK